MTSASGAMNGTQKRAVQAAVRAAVTDALRGFDAPSGRNIAGSLKDLQNEIRYVVGHFRKELTYLGGVDIPGLEGGYDPQSLREMKQLFLFDGFLRMVLPFAVPIDALPVLSLGKYKQTNSGGNESFRECMPEGHLFTPTELCYVLSVLTGPGRGEVKALYRTRNQFYVQTGPDEVVTVFVFWGEEHHRGRRWCVIADKKEGGTYTNEEPRRVFSRTKP